MNGFYSEFDRTTLYPRDGTGYRTEFQQDRDRVIYSFAFRRLQAKTQVFLAGEYDFYRTRLTHSIEVAQIGRSICCYLRTLAEPLTNDWYIDPDLVEAVCLAHDIGHPPFGHAGEASLNHLMSTHGGFEGNAQTLRIVAENLYGGASETKGMDPTRAFLDGVLKYKTLRKEAGNVANKFLYDEQEPYRAIVFDDAEIPSQLMPGGKLNKFRSIECQIMDWADDIAYSVNDLLDAIRAGFISRTNLREWAETLEKEEDQQQLRDLLDSIDRGTFEEKLNKEIGQFIQAVELVEAENFMSNKTHRYAFDLSVDREMRAQSDFYKKVATCLVFKSPEVGQLEYKANHMLEGIFNALQEVYINKTNHRYTLLPLDLHTQAISLPNKDEAARLICDYIAGMSDDFATRTYRRLFDPEFGSIADLV